MIVDLVYFNAGGGHRSAAQALSQSIKDTYPDWEVRVVNLTEILNYKNLGVKLEGLYNFSITSGMTFGLTNGLRFLQGIIKANNSRLIAVIEKHWAKEPAPNLIVSLIPNFNRCVYQSAKNILPNVPYVTIPLDMADIPPHFWMEEGHDQYHILGTDKLVSQAKELGYSDDKIYRVSGMMLKPMFYKHTSVWALDEQTRSLDKSKPIGIVLFGGIGSKVMITIAKRLKDTQLIFICGHGKSVANKIRKLDNKNHVVLEFITNVCDYMAYGDFMIGKPGPASISESIQMGLPVITFRNRFTMPQEYPNTFWIEDNGMGVIIKSSKNIQGAVDKIVENLEEFKSNAARIKNDAIFKIPEILLQICYKSVTILPK
jgi:UDP-N-acetylglucosamine:LPS N-acetylglucosamine transferase